MNLLPFAMTLAELLAAAPATDWRPIAPENLLVMELPAGRVLVELAPDFAPRHVANIRTLAKAKYWDGLAILRLQDNYVAQWGDPDEKAPRSFGAAARSLPPEWARPIAGMPAFTALPDRDTYAPETGFSAGFPAARDAKSGQAWLAHCYGMVGAGRDVKHDSGNGAELYAVITQATRGLDRNVTLVGRVVQGIDLLSSLRRGTKALGFYATAEERTPIRSVRLASDLPAAERPNLQALRTESATFKAAVELRRFPKNEWFATPAGAVDVCNVNVPVRSAAVGLQKP